MAHRKRPVEVDRGEPDNLLLRILERQLLPWALEWDPSRLIVAFAKQSEFLKRNAPLPAAVQCSHRVPKGPRVAVHGRRVHGNRSMVSAVWPEDKLTAPRMPMIICPLKGQMDFWVGDYMIHSPSGHFYLLPPDVPRDDGTRPHLLPERHKNGHCDLLWIRPCQQGVECWICHSEGTKHWGYLGGQHIFILDSDLYSYFVTLAREAEAGSQEWQALGRGLLIALVAILIREARAGRTYGPGQMNQIAPGAVDVRDPIAAAQQYIREHIDEPLSIDRIAHTVHMARTQFTNRFRAQIGQSFTEFLTICRLEKAQTLLKDTNWSVMVISSLVGVRPAHLRRLFLQHVGVSPRDYRAQARREAP